jgi:hypothetical protein
MELKSSLVVLITVEGAQDSPRSSIQVLAAFFALVISIHELESTSIELGGFHCSSIDSIVLVVVMVLMVRDPEMPKSI